MSNGLIEKAIFESVSIIVTSLNLGYDGHIEKNDVIYKVFDMKSPDEVEVIEVGNVYTLFQIGELRFRPGNIHWIGQPIVVPPKRYHGCSNFAWIVKWRCLLPIVVQVSQPSKVIVRIIS